MHSYWVILQWAFDVSRSLRHVFWVGANRLERVYCVMNHPVVITFYSENLHSLATFIRYTLLVPRGWIPLCLQNCLILCGKNSTRCWKHSSDILKRYHHTFAADLSAAHPWCESPVTTTSLSFSIGLRSGDCGCHLSKVNSLSCSRTSLRWFELCDMVHYPARSSIRRWVRCSH